MERKVNTKEIIQKLGGATKAAKLLGITPAAVTHWVTRGLPTPPLEHAYAIEAATGIPKEEIWVDYFNKLEARYKNGNGKTGNQKKPTKP